MAADVSITVEPRKSGDELRAEFRMAQRRRLLKGRRHTLARHGF
jgi:hypothetical protein